MVLRRVMLDSFPATSTVQFHPVILAIFDFAGILQRLREEISKVVVIGSVLETQVSNVTKVFVEFFCMIVRESSYFGRGLETTNLEIHRTNL